MEDEPVQDEDWRRTSGSFVFRVSSVLLMQTRDTGALAFAKKYGPTVVSKVGHLVVNVVKKRF